MSIERRGNLGRLLLTLAVLCSACGDDSDDADAGTPDQSDASVGDASAGDGDGDGDDAPVDRGDNRDTGDVDTRGTDGQWVTLGGNLASHYRNDAETTIDTGNVGSLEESWTLTTTGAPTGTAVVVDGIAYIPAGGRTYAVDALTGEEKWTIAEGVQSSLAWDEGTLYMHTSGSEVLAVDAESGEEKWRSPSADHTAASGFSSPIVVRHLVIVGTSSSEEVTGGTMATFRGAVVAFDKETGVKEWEYFTVESPHTGATVWSTVSVDLELDLVYASTGNNYVGEDSGTSDAIIALDLLTGEEQWVTQVTSGDLWTAFRPVSDDTDFGANPILFDAEVDGGMRKLLACGQKSGLVWIMDRENGDIVHSIELSGGRAMTGGVLNNGAFDGQHILIASNTGESEGDDAEEPRGESRATIYADGSQTSLLAAIDPSTGEVVWERQIGAWVWAPITVANGVGFVASERQVEAFDVSNGERLFTFATEGTVTSSPIPVDGRLYFGSGMTYLTGTPGTTFYSLALP